MSKTTMFKRFRALFVTMLLVAAANIAISYAANNEHSTSRAVMAGTNSAPRPRAVMAGTNSAPRPRAVMAGTNSAPRP